MTPPVGPPASADVEHQERPSRGGFIRLVVISPHGALASFRFIIVQRLSYYVRNSF
jgi:hypothetical protein